MPLGALPIIALVSIGSIRNAFPQIQSARLIALVGTDLVTVSRTFIPPMIAALVADPAVVELVHAVRFQAIEHGLLVGLQFSAVSWWVDAFLRERPGLIWIGDRPGVAGFRQVVISLWKGGRGGERSDDSNEKKGVMHRGTRI